MANLEELKQHYAAARAKGDQQNMEYFARQIQALQSSQNNLPKIPRRAEPSPLGGASQPNPPNVPKNPYRPHLRQGYGGQAESPNLPDEPDEEDEDNSAEPEFGQDANAIGEQPLDSEDSGDANPPQVAPTPAEVAAKEAKEAAQPPQTQASATPPGTVDGVTPAQKPAGAAQLQTDDSNAGGQVQPPQPEQTTESPQDQAKQQLTKNVEDKALKQTAKAAIRSIGAFIVANWLPITIAIFILVLGFGLFYYFYSPSFNGTGGKTAVQAVNAIDNSSAIKRLALLIGNKDLQQKLSHDVLTQIQQDLTEMKGQTTNADTKAKIDDALKAATDCAATPPKADACTSLPDKIKAVLVAFAQDPTVRIVPVFSGSPTHLPIDENKIHKPDDNWAHATIAHGQSISNKGHMTYTTKSGQVVGHDLYMTQKSSYNTKFGLPTGDDVYGEAIDLLCSNGAPVYAPFTGHIKIVDSRWEKPVVIQSDTDPKSVALLANIKLKEGLGLDEKGLVSKVTAGDVIGTTTNGHLHFELWINGKPINAGTTFKKTEIWANMKKALKLP